MQWDMTGDFLRAQFWPDKIREQQATVAQTCECQEAITTAITADGHFWEKGLM
jgi:hypothetical protein